MVPPLWRCSRRELLPGAVTFILSLTVGVEIGLLAGVVTDLAFVIQRTARPVLSIEKCTVSFVFGGANFEENKTLFKFPH